MRRVAARVTGQVQGVFFRDSTQQLASQLGLTGWVRNEPDGSVSIEAQGPPEPVDDLVSWLHVGPRSARVVHVHLTDLEPQPDEPGFAVI